MTGRNIILVTIVLFVALMIGSGTSSSSNQLNARNLLWVAVATAGVLAFITTMVMDYKKADERQRYIQLQATAVAFISVMTALFAVEMAHGLFSVNMTIAVQALFIGGVAIWSLAQALLERRNRV